MNQRNVAHRTRAFGGMVPFPDPIFHPTHLSCTAFLFFEEPIHMLLPPVVVSEGWDELLTVIYDRKPGWGKRFMDQFMLWRMQSDLSKDYLKIAKPLLHEPSKTIWLAYPADTNAIQRVRDMISNAGLTISDIEPAVDPISGAGEMMRHILLEMFLFLDEDITRLYEYCSVLYSDVRTLEEMTTCAYLFRVEALKDALHESSDMLLLTNRDLVPLLGKLDIFAPSEHESRMIQWAVFKEILSPYLDPLTVQRSERLASIKSSRPEQVQRLKRRCLEIGEKLNPTSDIEAMERTVARYVETHIRPAIQDVLEIDSKTAEEYVVGLLSDQRVLSAILSAATGLTTGHAALTLGGTIWGISAVGSRAVQSLHKRREALRNSDFELIYRMSKQTKATVSDME